MIDHHYGYLARDANDHVIELLDNHSLEQGTPAVDVGGRPVDAANHAQPWSRILAASRPSSQALHRTRTDDPFLTMEVLYQLS
jgi:hypothetical protein